MDKFIYLIRSNEHGYHKIGVSKTPQKRLDSLQTGNFDTLTLINKYQSKYAYKIEKTLHNLWRYLKINGEWYDLSINEISDFNNICIKIENNFNIMKTHNNTFL